MFLGFILAVFSVLNFLDNFLDLIPLLSLTSNQMFSTQSDCYHSPNFNSSPLWQHFLCSFFIYLAFITLWWTIYFSYLLLLLESTFYESQEYILVLFTALFTVWHIVSVCQILLHISISRRVGSLNVYLYFGILSCL